MDYMYMLRCGDGSYYTGWTNHLHKRLINHMTGKGAKYTRAHQPVELAYCEAYPDKSSGMMREAAVKKLTRQEKEALLGDAKGGRDTKVFYLMGKSASGKDKLFQALLQMSELRLRPLVIYTTRPIRDGEKDGVEYHFTDEEHALRWMDEGKIIELREYQTVHGPWKYFTLDDGSFEEEGSHILAIGTPESYQKLRSYLGAERLVPLYIEVDNGIRLQRSLERERKQTSPKYAELCRRFLADEEDFSEERLKRAGITNRISNNGKFETCLEETADEILLHQYGPGRVQ